MGQFHALATLFAGDDLGVIVYCRTTRNFCLWRHGLWHRCIYSCGSLMVRWSGLEAGELPCPRVMVTVVHRTACMLPVSPLCDAKSCTLWAETASLAHCVLLTLPFSYCCLHTWAVADSPSPAHTNVVESPPAAPKPQGACLAPGGSDTRSMCIPCTCTRSRVCRTTPRLFDAPTGL